MKTLYPKFSVFTSVIVVALIINENRADSQIVPSPSPPPAPIPPPSLNGVDRYLIVPGINPRRNQFDDLLRVRIIQTDPIRIEGCQVDKKQDASSVFFITGKSGLPPNPYEPLSSNHIWEDVPSPTQSSENYTLVPRASSSLWLSSNKTMEAQSWLINEKGEVVLVSEQPIAPVYRGCRLH